MREYIESEVKKVLINEGIDEGLGSDIMNWIMGKLTKSGNIMQLVVSYIKQNMKLEDLVGLALRTFGASAIINLICNALGIEANGIVGQAIKAGLAAIAGAATSGLNFRNLSGQAASEGYGGDTSYGGGGGFSGGGTGGGSR